MQANGYASDAESSVQCGVLEIRLLGGFEMRVDGAVVEESRWARRKSKTLVKLLALEPSREMHRDQLLELLWPEVEPSLAQNNLNKALHSARRALEPDLKPGAASRFILTREQRIALRAPKRLWVDVQEFEEAAGNRSPALLERAVELYSGDLLPEDRYEDWATLQRERLAKLFQGALLTLAEQEEQNGRLARAIQLLHQALKSDPCNEAAHRSLMRLFALAGHRHLAISQFRQCADRLKSELEVEVEPATQRLYERILAGEIGATAETPVTLAPLAAEPTQPVPAPPLRRRRWIAASIAVVVLAAGVIAWWLLRPPHVRPVHSLAVLPFESVADLEFISDGVTEDLINRLSRLPGIRVMARSTVFAYKGKTADPRKAGKEIGVPTVLSGHVTHVGDGLTVKVELVDVRDGSLVWGQRYSFPATDILPLQTRLAYEVATALELRLKNEQRRRLVRTETPSAEAHRNYLMGRYYWNRRTEDGFRTAIRYYELAVAKDPNYALAYAGLADAYGLLGFLYAPPRQYLPIARSMVSKALECDPELAEAYTSLAMIKALYDWDWPGAQEDFRRSIELNPGYATAYHWYGVHLSAMGRYEEARSRLRRALELDPLSQIIQTNSAYPDHYQRRYNAAIRIYRKALELDPNFAIAHDDLQLALEQAGRYAEALAEATQSREPDLVRAARAAAVPVTADSYRRILRQWRDDLIARSSHEYVSPMRIVWATVRSGGGATAFAWLEKALEERSAALVYANVDPVYDPIRPDPRFRRLLERIGSH